MEKYDDFKISIEKRDKERIEKIVSSQKESEQSHGEHLSKNLRELEKNYEKNQFQREERRGR